MNTRLTAPQQECQRYAYISGGTMLALWAEYAAATGAPRGIFWDPGPACTVPEYTDFNGLQSSGINKYPTAAPPQC